MISFPNCKINIGLSVTEKRSDGYHNLETVFYPVVVKDALEIVPASDGETRLFLSGIPVAGDPEKNTVIKTYRLLEKDFHLSPVHIYLYKQIPYGAGLGGGSSDAVHTLKILNRIFNLNLTGKELRAYAVKIGADCSFFLENRPLLASGTGDIFEKVSVTLNAYWLMLLKPPYSVNTREAYQNIRPEKKQHSLSELIRRPVSEWKECIFNDFEKTVCKQYPFIARIKEVMYNHGALYASMSGSGSAVYGIFSEQPAFQYPQECTAFVIPPRK